MTDPAVWLGDLRRVLTRLQPSPDRAAEILVLLGLTEPPPVPPPPPLASPPPAPGGWAPGVRSTAPQGTAARDLAAAVPTPSAQHARPTIVEPEAPTRVGTGAPRPVPSIDAVLPPPPTHRRPVDLGLLSPAQQRAVLSALCSRPTPTGELDLDALVDLLARREPLRDAPRQLRRSTRRGVQLLLDFGEGMTGFTRDREEVRQAIAQLAGRDGLEVLRFAGTPLDGRGAGPGPVWTWQPYAPPPWGRPVLVVSDLGAGRRPAERAAVQQQWLEVANRLRTAGCPVTALVPAPLAAIPLALRRALAVVSWDRGTSVRQAVASARVAGSHEVVER